MISMRWVRRTAVPALGASLALASCAGPRGVTDADRALAEMEGVFQCDVSRFAFEDVAAIDERLDGALAELAVDREDYREFKDFLAHSEELRLVVEEAYSGRC